MIFGIVLYFTCSLLHQKEYKTILLCALAYLAGLAVITAPLLAWFAAKDALWDLLYGTFIVPFSYSVLGVVTLNLPKRLLSFLLFPASIWSAAGAVLVTKSYRQPLGRFLLCCAAVSIAALIPGEGYFHYFLVTIPYITLSGVIVVTYICSHEKNSSLRRLLHVGMAVYLGALVVIFCFFFYQKWVNVDEVNRQELFSAQIDQEQGSMIPEDEKDCVLAYAGMQAAPWYNINDIIPCYKYCVSTFMLPVDSIRAEYADMLETDPPLWYVIAPAILSSEEPFDKMVSDALAEHYELVSSPENGLYLYRYNA